MATRKRILQAGGTASATAADRVAVKTAATAPDAKPVDLDDAETQRVILEPKPVELTCCGEKITLHPLPARAARQFAGLVGMVISDARNRFGGVSLERITAVLNESNDYTVRFAGYVGRATFPTDMIPTSEEHVKEIGRIQDASYTELGDLFDQMCTINKTNEAFAGPKK